MKRSPAAEALLRTYLEAEGPDAAHTERMLARLEASVAAGEMPRLPETQPPTLPNALSATAGKLSPALAAAVSGSLLLTSAWLFWREAPPIPHLRPAASATQPSAAHAPATHDNTVERAAELALPQTAISSAEGAAGAAHSRSEVPEHATRQRAGTRRPSRVRAHAPAVDYTAAPASVPAAPQTPPAQPSSTQAAPPSEPDGSLAGELALIRGAYASLRRDQASRALEQLDEHALRFPHGALAESREVARAIALCQSGAVSRARALAAQLLARSPGSPYAARLRSVCAEPSAR